MGRLWADISPLKSNPKPIEKVNVKNNHSDSKPSDKKTFSPPQSEGKSTEREGGKKSSPKGKLVTISICGKGNEQILSSVTVPIREGETALGLLRKVTISKGIQMEYRGSGSTSYVIGIANLYELDHGNQSGWMYRVNGASKNVSSGAYLIRQGDKIEWLYTCNSGKDVGATLR